MSSKIKHKGIIESVDHHMTKVRILQTSACATCSAAGHCGASESKEKVVDVYGNYNVREGEEVMVVASEQVGVNAVILGFGVPFLILIAALYLFIALTHNEPLAALGSIACLIPYYLILYRYREKLREKLSFTIEQIKNN